MDEVEPRRLLIHYLREVVGLTSSHIGCETSLCGACTVELDGRAIKSCTLFAVQTDGCTLLTIEELAQDGNLHPVPAEEKIRYGIEGNLCRCTGYQHIVNAVKAASAKMGS
ncbi:MAG: hypothetical protein EXQ58_08045 [Acidobacteria bacterium]|nr:hypothetical protein [Acidobacteriota bacterium]